MKTFSYTAILSLTLLQSVPLLAWDNGQAASYVLGQPDFVSKLPSGGARGLIEPYGLSYDPVREWLFVGSYGYRVMVYDLSYANNGGLTNYMPASYAIGQVNLTGVAMNVNGSSAPNAIGLRGATGVHYDPKYKWLYVGDLNNNRVLMYNLSDGITQANEPAIYALGQSSLSGPNAVVQPVNANTAQRVKNPKGVTFDPDSDLLYVACTGDNRINVYNFAGGVVNETPIAWIGQQNTGQYQKNRGFALPNAGTLSVPSTLHIAKENGGARWLYVSDEGNHRVLGYNVTAYTALTFPTYNLLATRVLGQPGFATSISSATGGVTASLLGEPSRAVYDPFDKNLFVADEANSRVLVYDISGGFSNGAPAVKVLGQMNFTSNTGDVSQRIGTHFEDVLYDTATQRLFAADITNQRVLVWKKVPDQCAGLKLCGKLTAAEAPNNNLDGIPVEVLDENGKLLNTKKTDQNGDYEFDSSNISGLAAGKKYFVHPIVKRGQSSIPLQAPVLSLPAGGEKHDFQVRGWPATIVVTNPPPMSVVLVTTFTYSGDNSTYPPPTGPGTGRGGGFSSGVANAKGATISVPSGANYYLTCWVANSSGQTTTYSRLPATGSQGPITVAPKDVYVTTCH